jgi:hypothetical protein
VYYSVASDNECGSDEEGLVIAYALCKVRLYRVEMIRWYSPVLNGEEQDYKEVCLCDECVPHTEKRGNVPYPVPGFFSLISGLLLEILESLNGQACSNIILYMLVTLEI